jgi:squalene-hopene/tetraprenyl-beta-curcumene cyclase
LDIADLESPDADFAPAWRALARQGAEYVAQARLKERAGGWSYFPGLPELPPDLDSLAAALLLFARIAPGLTGLCQEPIGLALANQQADGSLETWIVAPRDGPAQREAMERGIRYYWGKGSDADVLAHFGHALLTFDSRRYGDTVARIIPVIVSKQHPDGYWSVPWYCGPYYGTGLCLRLLRECRQAEAAAGRAVQFLRDSQNQDGCWGRGQMAPMDTALALWALSCGLAPERPRGQERALDALIEMQASQGCWTGAPWIQMGIGRAGGNITRVATYHSTTLTTAFCLRSLLQFGW